MDRMPFEPDLSLRRSKRVGVRICVGAALLAALFLWGIAVESYWALALPVAVAVLTALSLAFWIGYTVNTVRGIPAEAEHYRSDAARWIALGICAVSILLALVFLLGIVARSYWALAIPVAIAVLGLAGMVFWIGWAIVTQQPSAARPPTAAGALGAADRDRPA
jgi:O-antigen/teichoic acid export membrane protein